MPNGGVIAVTYPKYGGSTSDGVIQVSFAQVKHRLATQWETDAFSGKRWVQGSEPKAPTPPKSDSLYVVTFTTLPGSTPPHPRGVPVFAGQKTVIAITYH